MFLTQIIKSFEKLAQAFIYRYEAATLKYERMGSPAPAITHDFTSLTDLWTSFIFETHDYGKTGIVTGWRKTGKVRGINVRKGNFLILPDKKKSSRYRVTSIVYYHNPRDMWKAHVAYDPLFTD
jgi:hypothetical protein